jgi:hypothetical protein
VCSSDLENAEEEEKPKKKPLRWTEAVLAIAALLTAVAKMIEVIRGLL